VLAVDDGSTDRTAQILASYASRITVITNTISKGPAAARNSAAAIARGELLAFIDADCIAGNGWLGELSRCFTDNRVAAGGGRQDVPSDESPFGRKVAVFMRSVGFVTDYAAQRKEGIFPVSHNPSCNSIYRTDIFLEHGGFLEGLWPGEDVELDHRLLTEGYAVIYNRDAAVSHYRPDTMRGFSSMMYRYGWAQGFLARKYGIFRTIQAVPVATAALPAALAIFFIYNWKAALITTGLFCFGSGVFLLFDAQLLLLGLSGFIAWHRGYVRGILKI
jgi:mycofactocin glycosyltransferase